MIAIHTLRAMRGPALGDWPLRARRSAVSALGIRTDGYFRGAFRRLTIAVNDKGFRSVSLLGRITMKRASGSPTFPRSSL
jgi:hypothetical protein